MQDETAAHVGDDGARDADRHPAVDGAPAPARRPRGTTQRHRAGTRGRPPAATPRPTEDATGPPEATDGWEPELAAEPEAEAARPNPSEQLEVEPVRATGRARAPRSRNRRPEPPAPVEPWAGHDWLDQEAGPVVRPYTVTGGRARPVTGSLDLLSYVEALYAPDADVIHLQPEHRSILNLTRTALSVAEIAAHLDLPVGVVRVLIGDLVQANLVSTFSSGTAVHPPDESILQAVIDGLRAL
jgi:hypothetical protein